jgi:hypothetical protein
VFAGVSAARDDAAAALEAGGQQRLTHPELIGFEVA